VRELVCNWQHGVLPNCWLFIAYSLHRAASVGEPSAAAAANRAEMPGSLVTPTYFSLSVRLRVRLPVCVPMRDEVRISISQAVATTATRAVFFQPRTFLRGFKRRQESSVCSVAKC